MTWSAKIAAVGRKLNDPGVITATVVFSDGAIVHELYKEFSDDGVLKRWVVERIAQFNAADDLVSKYAKDQTIDLGDTGVLTSDQRTALNGVIVPELDDRQNADALNTKTIPNPVPQGTIPRGDDTPWAIGIFESLSDQFHKTWWSYPTIAEFVHALQFRGLRATLSFFITSGLRSGTLLEADAQVLRDARDSTLPDPNWSSQVTQAQALLGRPCTLLDVKQAR